MSEQPAMRDAVKAIREHRGLSQAQMGRIVGADHSLVSRWEKGTREPCIKAIRRMIERLTLTDVEATDLLNAAFFGRKRMSCSIVGGSVVVAFQQAQAA